MVAVTAIEEMELLVVARQPAIGGKGRTVVLGHEGCVNGGKAVVGAQRARGGGQHAALLRRIRTAGRHQARARGGGERRRGLQLRVIAPARPLEGIGPAVIEHIFALRMGLEIKRHGCLKHAIGIGHHKRARLPTGAGADRAGFFQ